ncbi:MAG: hypothetical protein WBC63_03625 [Candidatus Bipolaricaulia bacterium]
MSRLQRAILVRVVLFVAIVLGGCVSPVRIDLTGTWEGTLLWTEGQSTGFRSPISLDLTHVDRDLSGTVILMGPGSQPFDLTISGGRTSARSIRVEASGVIDQIDPPLSVSISLDGDFDETRMSGTGSQTFAGSTYEFTWEMVRISGPPEP